MDELAKALIGASAFASPKNILQAILESSAHENPSTATGVATHSIYEKVWHMAFWQDISLDWIQRKPTTVPEHASGGFTADKSEPWDRLVERFLTGTENAAVADKNQERLNVFLSPAQRLATYSAM